jgi:hypothetical protein
MSNEPWVEIYRAKDAIVAHLVYDALGDEGIQALIDGETLGNSFGALPLGWTTAPRILVPKEDSQRALELIKQFDESAESD